MPSSFMHQELFRACRELFGPEVDISAAFLEYIQPAGVKTAFRQRAKAVHPDSAEIQQADSGTGHETFLQLHDAYTLVSGYLGATVTPRRQQRTHSPSPSSPHPDMNVTGESVFRSLPRRRLLFGRYLYHLEIISYSTLLSAIAWQRQTTPCLGVLAREFGWLTHRDIAGILSSSEPGFFGERAVRSGLLTDRQRKQLLLQQRINHRRIGEYFVMQGIVTEQELAGLIKGFRLHNARHRGVTG